jgi:hypothetical protein
VVLWNELIDFLLLVDEIVLSKVEDDERDFDKDGEDEGKGEDVIFDGVRDVGREVVDFSLVVEDVHRNLVLMLDADSDDFEEIDAVFYSGRCNFQE